MDYESARALIDQVNPHYGMTEYKQSVVWKYVSEAATSTKVPLILELGVCHGYTAVLLAYITRETGGIYYGIDNFSLEGSADEVLDTFVKLGLAGNIIQASTQAAPWDYMVDVLLVDAGHDPVNVEHDVKRFIPFVKPGGIVIFDDYDSLDGPHWAVVHWAKLATAGWEILHQTDPGDGVMVARRPL